jgi:hypothetical protein
VRDVTNIDAPFTASTIPNLWPFPVGTNRAQARFVSEDRLAAIVYRQASGGGTYDSEEVIEMGLDGSQQVTLASAEAAEIYAFAWSPDGTKWTYLVNTQTDLEWHLCDGADRKLASLPTIPGIGGNDLQTMFSVAFSTDGNYVSLFSLSIFNPTASGGVSPIQVRRMDGTLVATKADLSPASNYASDPLWLGSALYFRNDAGVELWDGSTVRTVLPGVRWIRPKLSSDGKLIVYHAVDAKGLAHVFLFNPSSKTTRQLSSLGGAEPQFLSPRYIWYEQERLCVAGDHCGVGQYTPTGRTYIVDLQTGTETQSRLAWVTDTWPHDGGAVAGFP